MTVTRVKVCPVCTDPSYYSAEKCTTCNYIFRGDEEGATDRMIKLNTVISIPTDEEISTQISLLQRSSIPSKYSFQQVKFFSKQALIAFLISIAGFFLFIILGQLKGIFAFFGIVLMVGGVFIIFTSLWNFIRGPRMKMPEETISTFYRHGILGSPPNFERAWNCLTPGCKDNIGTLEDFKNYWQRSLKYVETNVPIFLGATLKNSPVNFLGNHPGWHISHFHEVKTVECVTKSENICFVTFDFEVRQVKDISTQTGFTSNKAEIVDGTVAFPQRKVLVISNNKWYLTSGTLDLPTEEAENS